MPMAKLTESSKEGGVWAVFKEIEMEVDEYASLKKRQGSINNGYISRSWSDLDGTKTELVVLDGILIKKVLRWL